MSATAPIAVTSATGYLGSHMLLALEDAGEAWLAMAGSGDLPPALGSARPLVRQALDDSGKIAAALRESGVRELIHFGAQLDDPALSLENPLAYYQSNVLDALRLAEACVQAGVESIVLSSTATVYGTPTRVPVPEEALLLPTSPYGASMTMAERIFYDVCKAAGIALVTLRYFNAAGADPAGRAGEDGKPRHLIKVATQIAVGTRAEQLKIFGTDYDTPDGTAIRDYVHVSDIADAHLAALNYLRDGGRSTVLNCGYGYGASVREVIAAVEGVTGERLATEEAPRRAGDSPVLIADTAAIRSVLDWSPRFDDLGFIVRTAIDWERAQA